MSAVYLDHAATTPVRPEVVEAMEPFATANFGNPSSLHRWGQAAAAALEDARAEIATALGAKASEVHFVRGGTESDNLAILGSCRALARPGVVPTVALSAIEHSAVLEAGRHLEKGGEARLVVLPVSLEGQILSGPLESALSASPSLVSVMWVNNETGMVLPVSEVTTAAAAHGATVHSDASQAIGKVPVHLGKVPVHLLTATGHKISGPKGMGILFVRRGTKIRPLIHGGGQERGMRPGTQDVAGAVGLATAIRLAVSEQEEEAARLGGLRDVFEHGLLRELPDVRINASPAPRAPHVSSIGVPGLSDGDALLMALDLGGVAVSGGSACMSGAGHGSHVIAALYGDDDPMANVRFSFGHTTRESDIDLAIAVTAGVVRRLRGEGMYRA